MGSYDNWSKGQLEEVLREWPSAVSPQHVMARQALDQLLEREKKEEIERNERRHRESLDVNADANRLSKRAIWVSIAAAAISLISLAVQVLDHCTRAIPVGTKSAAQTQPIPSPISTRSPQSISATEPRSTPGQTTPPPKGRQ